MTSTASNCEFWYPHDPGRPFASAARTIPVPPAFRPHRMLSEDRGSRVASNIAEHLPPYTRVTSPERKLAQGVLLAALIDYGDRHDAAIRNEAAEFIFGTDTRALAYWCGIADTTVSHVRSAAHDVDQRSHKKAYRYLLNPHPAGTDGTAQ